jgi:hypothetical protein
VKLIFLMMRLPGYKATLLAGEADFLDDEGMG